MNSSTWIETFNYLNKRLVSFVDIADLPCSLADGKMGICLYFYQISLVNQDITYKQTADDILDIILNEIDSCQSCDIKNGLAGIGLSIEYLIEKGFVQGNSNHILKDIDDSIIKNLSNTHYNRNISVNSLIHILYYLSKRLMKQKKNSENAHIYKDVMIFWLNKVYNLIIFEPQNQKEPLTYSVDFTIPQFLYLLSEIYTLKSASN